MFRVGHLYFMKIYLDTIQNSTSTGCDEYAIKKELLLALETARSRLAIAIAEETKSTPGDRRQYFLDTADYMRHRIIRLRDEGCDEKFQLQDWISALEALRKIPAKDRAQPLCKRLRRIVMTLE